MTSSVRIALLMLGYLVATAALPLTDAPGAPIVHAQSGPVYVAYYWRAKPGMAAEYSAYIKGTAERIDEDARKTGAFIEVRTVLATTPPDGPAPDWTHLRIFTLPDLAALERLAAALDAATLRVVPDEAQRKANAARSASLRDPVRREVWTTLR
jgi:hypothetical protein